VLFHGLLLGIMSSYGPYETKQLELAAVLEAQRERTHEPSIWLHSMKLIGGIRSAKVFSSTSIVILAGTLWRWDAGSAAPGYVCLP